MQNGTLTKPAPKKFQYLVAFLALATVITVAVAIRHHMNTKSVPPVVIHSTNAQQPTVASGPYAGASDYYLTIKNHALVSPNSPIIVKQNQPILMTITSNSPQQEDFFVNGQGGLSVEVETDDGPSHAYFTPAKLGFFSFGLKQTVAPYETYNLGLLEVVSK